jgi:hypothetical protein
MEEQASKGSIQALVGFTEDMERRIAVFQGEERNQIEDLEKKKEALREATIQGSGETYRQAVSDAEAALARTREQITALADVRDGRAGSKHLEKLRADALNEIREGVAEKRRFWQEDLRVRLAAKKDEFLALVEEAGRLYREGSRLVGTFVAITEGVPGVKPGAPAFMTDIVIRQDRHVGPIFISPEETEKAFRKGA